MFERQPPHDYVKITEKYLKCLYFVGLDLLDESYVHLKLLPRNIRSIFICMFPTLLVFIIAFSNRDGDDELVDRVQVILILVTMLKDIVTLVIITRNREKLRRLYQELAELWPRDELFGEQAKIKKHWLKRVDFFHYVFMWVIYFAAPVYFVVPFTINMYNYFNYSEFTYICPLDSCKPWKTSNIFVYIVVAFLESIIVSGFHIAVPLSFRMMITTFTCKICFMLNLFQMDLENFVQKQSNSGRRNREVDETNESNYRNIVKLIKTHQKLLNLVKNLSDTSGTVIFISLGASLVFLCASLLNTVSSQTVDRAYASLWYETDPRTAKLIIIIIMRSQKPAKLEPLGFCILGFSLFTSMLSLSWSFFTVLYQMQSK